MTDASASLGELVVMLNDGIEFYLGAADKVSDPGLSEFFRRMSYLKKRIAADLNAEIANEGGEPREAGSLLGNMRKGYADVLAKLSDQTVQLYIAQLEEHEDRMIAAFRQAILADESVKVRELALVHFPEIEKMHAQMRQLKRDHQVG